MVKVIGRKKSLPELWLLFVMHPCRSTAPHYVDLKSKYQPTRFQGLGEGQRAFCLDSSMQVHCSFEDDSLKAQQPCSLNNVLLQLPITERRSM